MLQDKKTTKQIFNEMWDKIILLKGSLSIPLYKWPVLSLFFLKYLNDRFWERREKIPEEQGMRHIDNPHFYKGVGVVYLPLFARWEKIRERAKTNNILVCLDEAFQEILKENQEIFYGTWEKDIFVRSSLDPDNVSSLMDIIVNVNSDQDDDFLGKAYQFLLNKFSSNGQEKGEYYTPQCIVNLIASLIEPYEGKIYDPCCGSGGMFVQAKEMVKKIQHSYERISIYGQELDKTTHTLCKMNLTMRGIIDAKLGQPSCTLKHDQHPNLKVDYVMSNPPFNWKDWRSQDSLVDDPRWKDFGVAPVSNANYAWICHILDKLSQNGVGAILLANKSLDAKGREEEIRKKLIDRDFVEAIVTLPRKTFYNTDIAVSLWIINRNKKYRELKSSQKILRDRTNEILFIDARELGSPYEKSYIELTAKDIELITKTFHSWRCQGYPERYEDVDGFCRSVNIEELKNISPEYSLFPNQYIPFKSPENQHEWAEEMKQLTVELTELLDKDKELNEEVKNILLRN